MRVMRNFLPLKGNDLSLKLLKQRKSSFAVTWF